QLAQARLEVAVRVTNDIHERQDYRGSRPPVQFRPWPASRGRRTGSGRSRGTNSRAIQFPLEKIMANSGSHGMMDEESAMRHLRRTLSWLLAAALTGTLCPLGSQAKGYSSGGHSYSSQSHSFSSGGSHSFGG